MDIPVFSTLKTIPLVYTPLIDQHCRKPIVTGFGALNPAVIHAGTICQEASSYWIFFEPTEGAFILGFIIGRILGTDAKSFTSHLLLKRC